MAEASVHISAATEEEAVYEEVTESRTKYVDLLADRRGTSDVRWAVREWHPCVTYKHGKDLTREDVFKQVLSSERIQRNLLQLTKDGKDMDSLLKEASTILDQMGHTQDISNIRKFGVLLPKIMKRIYSRVMINEDGIEKIKACIPDTPVVILPTHRSYADFLLVSYITFHYNLPCPVIAAGMDFMSMAVVGDWLRGCGAFYIRRSFVDDPLYWPIFQEYVQTLVKYSGCPMEFFLEGTRSRSGKCLTPKLGLLGCIAETWLRGDIPDAAMVPISISYDRTLEEKLYAYELLGVPKPQESTSGLLKAMQILKDDFGTIHVHIGEPMYLRSYLDPRLDRRLRSSAPFYFAPLQKNEISACESLGRHTLRSLQKGAVTSVWSIASIFLMEALWRKERSVSFAHLLREVSWLVPIIQKAGGTVALEGTVEHSLNRSLSTHMVAALLDANNDVQVQQIHPVAQMAKSKGRKEVGLKETTVMEALTHILLQHYINQLIHILICPAIVAHILLNHAPSGHCTQEELKVKFEAFQQVFSYEFIFESDYTVKDIHDSLSLLAWNGDIVVSDAGVVGVNGSGQFIFVLESILKPFLFAYHMVLETLKGTERGDHRFNEAALLWICCVLLHCF
ncbi:dihydroxyacetone phosphate acyltransferase isoform X2 [Oratosquilla oratoria]|uniref:dihydroxyacetone phosphate acyltransferase isoform X2 n=1 Tax=Oratosquilla oratoria TaxID=337810 RepID=UPI003F772A27